MGRQQTKDHAVGGALAVERRADVAHSREVARRSRVVRLTVLLWAIAGYGWLRFLTGNPIRLGWPHVDPTYAPAIIIVVLLGGVLLFPMIGAGRSPHVLYRPNEIDVTMDDVKGAGVVREEVLRTLNLFLAYKTFKDEMGGTPRRAILFEGPPGTGKTYMAKALAREAGVPFLFVSSSAFQSMYYGQTNRKIRSYFKALRRMARREGGAIGFIEEIDAIGAARSGMGASTSREGISGVVNELLIQLQSFDEPPALLRLGGWFVDQVNRFLPMASQLRKPVAAPANVLVVGATNRREDLDPALLRPGRFDRAIYFGLPDRSERLEIIDYYLAKKAHEPELDDPARRAALAAATSGYSPVMLEHLFDEALVWALRRGGDALGWWDIQQAKLTEEVGLKQPVEYTANERLAIATHEAGHATVAYLVGRDADTGEPLSYERQLDLLSIVKRRDSLGVLAHSDRDERFTRTRSELLALIGIAFGGMVAEELAFGEAGSGPSGDLSAATTLGAQMVGSFGMAGTLISLDAASMAGAGNVVAKVIADDDSRKALEDILQSCKATAARLLRSNRHILAALRDALIERHELVGEEILDVIHQAELSPYVLDLREGADRPTA
jgi:ATP-dependent Zn protease